MKVMKVIKVMKVMKVLEVLEVLKVPKVPKVLKLTGTKPFLDNSKHPTTATPAHHNEGGDDVHIVVSYPVSLIHNVAIQVGQQYT